MKLSRYKRKMLVGFIVSVIAVWVGSLILKHFVYPVLGVPFLIGGGFSSFFFFIYMIGEYEEDSADSRSISDIANGHIHGLEVRKSKRDK